MDIRQIRAFIAVANNSNFTKAAEEMFMTQSSISKIIKSLEEELATQLFYRSPNIELTDSGKELYTQSIHIISLIDSIPAEIESVVELKKGEIKIGIPPIIGASFFPKIIGEFKSTYPNIDIILIEVGSKRIEEMLEKAELDIGIVCSYPKNSAEYNMVEYVNSPLMLGLNINNPLAKKDMIEYKDLKNENFILFQEDFSLYDFIIKRCLQNNFHPNVTCNSSQRDFIVEMVASELGVTFLPEIICSKITRPEICFKALEDPKIFLNLLMVWRKNRYLSYASRKFLKFAAAQIGIKLDIDK